MNQPERSHARTGRILRFLFKYRNAGLFSGLDLDAASVATIENPATEGKPEEFVSDLEALGPTFIKIGQALSTRADMVPPEYLIALERMQDHVAPVTLADIRAVIEEALGVRLSKAFETFDETPLGSASLAQVHRATLRGGRVVAVKVQRPNAAQDIRADLDALASIAGRVDQATDIGRRMRLATGCRSSARHCWPNSTTASRRKTWNASASISPNTRSCWSPPRCGT